MSLSTLTLILASSGLLLALVALSLTLYVARTLARRVDALDVERIEARVRGLVGEYQSALLDLEQSMTETLQKARAQYARLRKAQKAEASEAPQNPEASENGAERAPDVPAEAVQAQRRADAYADAQRLGLWP